PDQVGFDGWSQALAHGASRLSVALGFIESPESDSLRVQAGYQKFLHRAADPSGLAFYVSFLTTNSVTQLNAGLAGSAEYFSDVNHFVDQAYVRQVYRELL